MNRGILFIKLGIKNVNLLVGKLLLRLSSNSCTSLPRYLSSPNTVSRCLLVVSATSLNDEEENAELSDDLKTEPLGVFFSLSSRFDSSPCQT